MSNDGIQWNINTNYSKVNSPKRSKKKGGFWKKRKTARVVAKSPINAQSPIPNKILNEGSNLTSQPLTSNSQEYNQPTEDSNVELLSAVGAIKTLEETLRQVEAFPSGQLEDSKITRKKSTQVLQLMELQREADAEIISASRPDSSYAPLREVPSLEIPELNERVDAALPASEVQREVPEEVVVPTPIQKVKEDEYPRWHEELKVIRQMKKTSLKEKFDTGEKPPIVDRLALKEAQRKIAAGKLKIQEEILETPLRSQMIFEASQIEMQGPIREVFGVHLRATKDIDSRSPLPKRFELKQDEIINEGEKEPDWVKIAHIRTQRLQKNLEKY